MNRIRTAIAIVTIVVTAIATPAAAEDLTLERLFQSPALGGPAPRVLKLSPDGRLATVLRNREDDRDRYDLWAIDTTTGAERMLIDSTRIGSGAALSEEEKMRRERQRIGALKGITTYFWAPDGKSLLVPLDGDLYLASLDGQARRLTDTPETEIDAKVSDSGRYVSFVRNQNLFAIDLTTGKEQALTTDGRDAVSWGTAEFVAQEELDRYTGTWWGPGDARVAVQRTDESRVKIVHRASIGADGTKVYDQRYPAAGTPNAVVQLWIMNADGSGRVQVDLGADPDFYLARVTWARDGSLYVQRLSRDQKRLDMLKVDAATGHAALLFSETSKTWVNLSGDFRPLDDGSLIWSSQRSGMKHLYRWVGGKWTQLTRGDWTLEGDPPAGSGGLIGVDQRRHRLFFTANKDDVLESQVYAIDYLKPGAPERLTERGYWNDAQMDGSGQRLLVRRSSPHQPPQTYLADASGKRLSWISENAVIAGHPYYPYLASHRDPVFGTMKAADGSLLHWKMITPANMVPGRKYPVFMEHYGGPSVQTVQRSWANPISQYLVDKGWIYFEIDNRGSLNRGRTFEDQIYHAMGTVEVEDQVAAAKWLKTLDYVDGAKLVTYGWSYGGYMTLKLLQKAPGLFAAGIAGAPVTDWALYDTAYTERYLGDPTKLPKVYAESGALADAAEIRDPLLVIHGMADDNVVFENSTMLFAKLQAEKVPFEMMVYPGKTHSVAGEGAQTHVWKTIENFLATRVK